MSSTCLHDRGDNERDVFNEKPSKEELAAATQVFRLLHTICHMRNSYFSPKDKCFINKIIFINALLNYLRFS